MIRQPPDATLEELRPRLGASCRTMTISRAQRELGLPRKTKVPRAQEQDRPEVRERRRESCEELAGRDPRRLVFVDECGANTAMTRTQGRAPVGQRVDAMTRTQGRAPVGQRVDANTPGRSALHDVPPDDIAGWFGDRAAYAMQR